MTYIQSSAIIRSLILDGREDDALKMCQELGSDTPEIYCNILDTLEGRGDNPRFLTLSAVAERFFSSHPGIVTRRVKALLASGHDLAAANTCGDFIERTGDHGLWAMYAESLMRSGDPAKAGEVLHRYMPANPSNGSAWIITARLLNAFPDSNIKGIQSGLDYEISMVQTEIDVNSGKLHFARGLMLETQGDFCGAARAFERGNEIFDAVSISDPDEPGILQHELTASFTPDWIAERQTHYLEEPRPIFILGSTHCGKEDVQKIIASDPKVLNAGSMRMLERDLHNRFGDAWGVGYAAGLASLTRADITALRFRYIDAMPGQAHKLKWFVDGASLNLIHAGVLKAMFPEASFLICEADEDIQTIETFRSPDDIEAYSFSADLIKIRRNIEASRDIATHWIEMFPDVSMRVGKGKDIDIGHIMADFQPGPVTAAMVPEWPAIPKSAFAQYAAWSSKSTGNEE